MEKLPTEILLHHLRELVGERALTGQSDADLVQRFTAHHDEVAFAALLRRHGPMVLGVCRRILHDWHAAEDAFQATFFVLARSAASIRKRASVSSWLYGVASQIALRAKAAAARRRQREQRAPVRGAPSVEADVSWREVNAVLDEEVNRLPERYRAPMVLCYLSGLTREEAARQLGWALRTLKRRLEGGKELLRRRLARRGLAPAAAPCAAALSQYLSAVPVPAELAGATLKGALLFTGAPALTGASAPAGAMADTFLKAVFVGKLKLTSALLVLTCLALASFGMAVHHAFSATDSPAPGKGPAAAPTSGREVGPNVVKMAPAPRADRSDPDAVSTVGTFAYRLHGLIRCVALAPVGSLLAAGGDGDEKGARVWDAGTGKELYRLDLKSGVSALTFSGDGKLLAVGSEDKALRLLDAVTGKELFCVEAHGREGHFTKKSQTGQALNWQQVSALVFSPDGKTLISGGHDGTVRLWDVARKQEIFQFKMPGCAVHSLAVSCDGQTLAAGCEEVGSVGCHPIFLWDMAARRELRPPLGRDNSGGHMVAIKAVAFAPDGKSLTSAGMDGEVMLWDVGKGEVIRTYRALSPVLWCVQAVTFSPDGQTLVAGDIARQIFAWEVRTGEPFHLYVERQPGNPNERKLMSGPGIRSLLFAPDGKTLISAGSDERVHLWEVTTGNERLPDATAPTIR